ncbi:MAG: AsmA family protein [Bryobacter sp.]|jgi:hypothetical protein|nr:AsmA family protein [Bryobacter sp. CoA8 C33]
MKKKISLLALVLIAGALAVPYFSAAPARQSLINALETALSRQVRIQGPTRIRVLPIPAILADDVTIAEDPSFSLEPFAYVTTIEVQPAFLALLSGRLEPARIRLTEPSVNLMRSSRGWNIESLISRKLRAPELEVRNGRLNFKQDNLKNPFYLTNTLVDISATSTGDIKIFASAEPARTDRGPQGFGVFSLRGLAHIPNSGEPTLDFDLELQPSALHAFNFFFGARGVNFAGKLAGKAHIQGPWSRASIQSTLRFEGLEPQGFLPFSGKSNRLDLKGTLDLPGQRFALDSTDGDHLRVRMRAREFFYSPRGGLLLDLRGVAAAKLLDLGQEASVPLPAGIQAEGLFHGVISYTWPSREHVPAQGMVWFSGAKLVLPDQPPLTIPEAFATVDGSHWRLQPAPVGVGESQNAVFEVDWNARNGALKLDIATQLVSVRGLKTGLGLLVQASSLPLLAQSQSGSWQGNLRYQRNEDADPGQWSGQFTVRNLEVDLEGVPGHVMISTGAISFNPASTQIRRLRAEWDGAEFEGALTLPSRSDGPVSLNLVCPEASGATIEKLLGPAQRPPTGLLEKMRLRRAAFPDWLRRRHVVGRIVIKSLNLAGAVLSPVSLQINWRSSKAEALLAPSDLTLPGQPGAARLEGKISTDFWQPNPLYRFEGLLAHWPLDRGQAAGALNLRMAFLDASLLGSLDGELALTSPEAARILLRQGKLTLEWPDGRRKSLMLSPPYWPFSWPVEP